jgi:hypothetical protein
MPYYNDGMDNMEELFGDREIARAKLARKMKEREDFDNLMASAEITPFVGMRVKSVDDGALGTIIAIALRKAPFRVKWDYPSIDQIDWFYGDQIRSVEV